MSDYQIFLLVAGFCAGCLVGLGVGSDPHFHGGEGASWKPEVVAPKGTDAQAK